jgi:NitT/TauT family transport system substrate-binding protein
MNNRKFGLACCAAALIILSAGCTSQSSESANLAAQHEVSNITVAALPSDDLAGLYIAQDDGLFSAEGLHVTIEKIASSQAVIAAQLKGQVNIGAGSYVPYIEAQADGARFRILSEASILGPNTRVLVTTKSAHITSLAGLVRHDIGVNGTNSIGTLLISALLQENGIPPKSVHLVTDSSGFPAMPGQLQSGGWGAAFLAEPYVTIAEENYGDHELIDLDQGAMQNFPIDGYVATQSWAAKNPKTISAFVHAIQEGQSIAANDPLRARAAIAKSDGLPGEVTDVMALPGFPIGPVSEQRIQREATAMLEFGILGAKYSDEVDQGNLVRSMIG